MNFTHLTAEMINTYSASEGAKTLEFLKQQIQKSEENTILLLSTQLRNIRNVCQSRLMMIT